MKIPARLFTHREITEAEPGSLVYASGAWHLAVRASGKPGELLDSLLALTGGRTGQLFRARPDFAIHGGVVLSADAWWEPTVPQVTDVSFDGKVFSALGVSSVGPLIWGDRGGAEQRVFNLAGEDVSDQGLLNYMHFPKHLVWTVEVGFKEGRERYELFTVDVT